MTWPLNRWRNPAAVDRLRGAMRRIVPAPLIRLLRRRWHRLFWPRVGHVEFGDLRRVTPISRGFGYDRGQPIDRAYIEAFLARHQADILGQVLEFGDNSYTRRFGGDKVARGDIVDVSPENRSATFIDDIANSTTLPSDAFDCVIATQTLQFVYDLPAAVATLERILKPGGVLLLTCPGISQLDDPAWNSSWHWLFTGRGVRRLLEAAFPAENITVKANGNVLAASAFLHGLAAEELSPEELAYRDPPYEVIITARAVKPHCPGGASPAAA
jgi:SAM-dependent methyltransferase